MKIPEEAVWVSTGDILWMEVDGRWHPNDGGRDIPTHTLQTLITNLDSNGLSVQFLDGKGREIKP